MALLPVAYRGSYLRRLLAPRRPVEHALLSVIQQTYLTGSSTRTVDALAESVGVPGADPIVVESQASDWDLRVEAFRERTLREPYPYLMLVETPALVREAGEVQTCQIVVAVAIDQPRRVAGEEGDAAIEPGRRQQRHADIAATNRPGCGRSLDRKGRGRSAQQGHRDQRRKA